MINKFERGMLLLFEMLTCHHFPLYRTAHTRTMAQQYPKVVKRKNEKKNDKM